MTTVIVRLSPCNKQEMKRLSLHFLVLAETVKANIDCTISLKLWTDSNEITLLLVNVVKVSPPVLQKFKMTERAGTVTNIVLDDT